MEKRFCSIAFRIMLLVWMVGCLLLPMCRAQADKPLFWTSGGNWGPWTKDPAHPGIASRAACGDDSTMKSFPVSSEDWQTRNGYEVPIGIVFRVQFFDKQINRNAWTGWMQQDLQPGEVTDGWTVVSGHCADHPNTKGLTIQTRCVVRAGEESDKCYKDENGNAYPVRPADAFRGSHDPGTRKASGGSHASHKTGIAGSTWECDMAGGLSEPNGTNAYIPDFVVTFQGNGTADMHAVDGGVLQQLYQLQWTKHSDGTIEISDPKWMNYFMTHVAATQADGYWVFTEEHLAEYVKTLFPPDQQRDPGPEWWDMVRKKHLMACKATEISKYQQSGAPPVENPFMICGLWTCARDFEAFWYAKPLQGPWDNDEIPMAKKFQAWFESQHPESTIFQGASCYLNTKGGSWLIDTFKQMHGGYGKYPATGVDWNP